MPARILSQSLLLTNLQTYMNPITSFFVFACLIAAGAAGYFVNPYLGVALFAVAVVIGSSLPHDLIETPHCL
jgi:hypothetical protein